MAIKEVTLNFTNEFKGELIAPNTTVKIGSEVGTLEPYDMLLGALGSCIYDTFIEIAVKKRIKYDGVKMQKKKKKRGEIPTTLKNVNIEVIITNAEKEKGLEQAFKISTEYCSIYTTISKVAEMNYNITFA